MVSMEETDHRNTHRESRVSDELLVEMLISSVKSEVSQKQHLEWSKTTDWLDDDHVQTVEKSLVGIASNIAKGREVLVGRGFAEDHVVRIEQAARTLAELERDERIEVNKVKDRFAEKRQVANTRLREITEALPVRS